MNLIHRLIFKTEMGEGTITFAKNISYTTLGNLGLTFFLFFVNIAAVRYFGPEEYGKYALVLSVSNFLIIPMFFGMNISLLKYVPEHKDDAVKQRAIISTATWMIIFCALFFGAIFYLFRNQLSALVHIPAVIFLFAVIYTVPAAIKNTAESILKGQHQFGKHAALEVVFAAAIFAAFFIMFFSGRRDFAAYVIAIVVGFAVYSAIVFIKQAGNLSLKYFDKTKMSAIIKYGILTVFSSLSWSVITGADRFLLNKYADLKTVGIYVVYVGASSIIISRVLSIFLNVFFPTVSGIKNRWEVNKRIDRLLKLGLAPFLALNCAVMYVMFLIYGKNYPVNFFWIIIFSLSAVLFSFSQIKWNLIFSEGVAALKTYVRYSFVGAGFSLFLNFVLIIKFGVLGAVYSSLAVSLYFLLAASHYLKKRTVATENL